MENRHQQQAAGGGEGLSRPLPAPEQEQSILLQGQAKKQVLYYPSMAFNGLVQSSKLLHNEAGGQHLQAVCLSPYGFILGI